MHTVQIQCPRCKNRFRDSAMRLQSGYSRQCPSCEMVIFFDEDSENPVIKRVMREARRLRKMPRQVEAEPEKSPGEQPEEFSRSFTGRSRPQGRTE